MKRLVAVAVLLLFIACVNQNAVHNIHMSQGDVCFNTTVGAEVCISKEKITHTSSWTKHSGRLLGSYIFIRGYRYTLNIPHAELRKFLRCISG